MKEHDLGNQERFKEPQPHLCPSCHELDCEYCANCDDRACKCSCADICDECDLDAEDCVCDLYGEAL